MNEPSEKYVMLRNLNAKLRAELAEKQQDIERYLRDKEGEIADLRAQLAEKEAAKNKLNELLCAEKQQIREERDAIIAKLREELQRAEKRINAWVAVANKMPEEMRKLLAEANPELKKSKFSSRLPAVAGEGGELPSSLKSSADTFNSVIHERNKLRAQLAAAKQALQVAKDTIKIWHGEVAWPEYQHSPEMDKINTALSSREGGAQQPTKKGNNVQ